MAYTNISLLPIVFRTQIGYPCNMSTMPSRSNHKVKVFIADDSLIVRERLVMMLDELAGIEIVGQAENVAEAISLFGSSSPTWSS